MRAVVNDSGILNQMRVETKNEALFLRRKENLEELAQWFGADRHASGAGDLAAQLALLSNADRGEPGNQVRLMSLHSAKGLEFRTVFIVGCEQGSLPHQASLDEGQLAEDGAKVAAQIAGDTAKAASQIAKEVALQMAQAYLRKSTLTLALPESLLNKQVRLMAKRL